MKDAVLLLLALGGLWSVQTPEKGTPANPTVEKPAAEKPVPEKPAPGRPVMGKPAPEEPAAGKPETAAPAGEKPKRENKDKNENKDKWGPIQWGPIDLSLGASFGRSVSTDEGTGHMVVAPIIQSVLVKNGFGVALDLNLFATDVLTGAGDTYPSSATLHVRPLAGGVSWTRKRGPFSFDVAGLVGYSFNGVDTPGQDRRSWTRGRAHFAPIRDVRNSGVFEAKAGIWYEFLPKLSLRAEVTYLATRPELLMEDGTRQRWRADRVIWNVGIARTFRLNMPRPNLPAIGR